MKSDNWYFAYKKGGKTIEDAVALTEAGKNLSHNRGMEMLATKKADQVIEIGYLGGEVTYTKGYLTND